VRSGAHHRAPVTTVITDPGRKYSYYISVRDQTTPIEARRSPRVERRQRQTRDRIFRAALDLFLKKGFAQTTVAEIAEAADIGKGTFFTYFPTKEAVLGYLGSQVVADMEAAVERSQREGLTLAQTLRELFAEAGRWHDANRPLAVLRLRAGSAPQPDNLYEMQHLIERLVSDGQSASEFRADVPARRIAIALGGIYFATVFDWTVNEPDEPLADGLPQALELLLAGIRS
jgi:AcrR family transcriptional regulator